jgi:hypothetical protein
MIFLSTNNKMQLYIIFFITVNALHVSSGFPPIIRSSNLYMQHRVLSNLFAATASNLSTLAVTTNKFDKYPILDYRFELLMMGGKTALNM